MTRRLFVIAAPSGAGKTSLVKALLDAEPRLRVCVSHTTRRKRPSEQHERDYYFVTPAQFHAIRESGGFLESAKVFDNWYGTSRMALEKAFAQGYDVILEIDWQGARQVRAKVPECISIFVLPPSLAALEQRLRARRTDSEEVIQRRLRDAVEDISHYEEFDYTIVNDDFATALADLRRIIAGPAPDLASDRPSLTPLLTQLLGRPPSSP